MSEAKRKQKMPRGMYIGAAWIGLAVFMFLCWIITFMTVNDYVRRGVGDVANFMTILILVPIFGFMIPMLLGIRTMRRAGREARQAAADEQASSVK